MVYPAGCGALERCDDTEAIVAHKRATFILSQILDERSAPLEQSPNVKLEQRLIKRLGLTSEGCILAVCSGPLATGY